MSVIEISSNDLLWNNCKQCHSNHYITGNNKLTLNRRIYEDHRTTEIKSTNTWWGCSIRMWSRIFSWCTGSRQWAQRILSAKSPSQWSDKKCVFRSSLFSRYWKKDICWRNKLGWFQKTECVFNVKIWTYNSFRLHWTPITGQWTLGDILSATYTGCGYQPYRQSVQISKELPHSDSMLVSILNTANLHVLYSLTFYWNDLVTICISLTVTSIKISPIYSPTQDTGFSRTALESFRRVTRRVSDTVSREKNVSNRWDRRRRFPDFWSSHFS